MRCRALTLARATTIRMSLRSDSDSGESPGSVLAELHFPG